MNKAKNITKISENLDAIKPPKNGEKIVLHACCAPCNLEPYRLLKESGWDLIVIYSNSNIYPELEFNKRWAELEKWCSINNAKVIKDKYDISEWEQQVLPYGEHQPRTNKRKLRCGQCYQQRLEHAAKYAHNNGINYLASTLAVSPYQYNDVLEDRLKIVCNKYKINPVFMDFRPYYQNATKRSKDLGMYRQKYCGCEFSFKESWKQFERSKNKKYLEELKSIISS